MALIKALLIAGLITAGLFAFIFWIIPLFTFLIIYAGIALIAYAIIKEEKGQGPL
jgi:hypothetical protein